MEITSNFNETALILNLPIVVRSGADTFIFNMPSIEKENGISFNYGFFLACCSSSLDSLKEKIKEIEFNSKYELMLGICKAQFPESVDIIACLAMCIQNFEYVEDSFKSGASTFNEEIFELFCDYISIATGCNEMNILETKKKFRELSDWEKEWERRRLQNESRIKAAKAKEGKGTSLPLVIASVIREFDLSLDEIKKMNKYGLYFFYQQVGKIMGYEMTTIAAGTGNLSKKNKLIYWANQK